MTARYHSIGYREATTLALAGLRHGASEAELEAIKRLQDFRGERVDIERLAKLAALAGLPWLEMFPELGW